MPSNETLNTYARLLVRTGVNLQPGQPLVVRCALETADFVRRVVKEAYLAGASSVDVQWQDDEITRLGYTYRSIDSLSTYPDWMVQRTRAQQAAGAALLAIVSEDPDAFRDVDPGKHRAAAAARQKATHDLEAYTMNNHGQWCVAAVPSSAWAGKVFPDLSSEAAMDALWKAILHTVYLDQKKDAETLWAEHSSALQRHAAWLNERQFVSLHFVNELGTDLVVGLAKHHIWGGGSEKCIDRSCEFQPNMPTEEIFTTPDRTRVNGIVYASRPLSHEGRLIRDFSLRFVNGEVAEYHCAEGEEALVSILRADEHSRYLGEVALVPYDSPISQSGILFYNTLFDENAACHLALGASYPGQIEGGGAMSEEELLAHGGNVSAVHVDFMFGSREMRVTGIDDSGNETVIFEHGSFVI